jgi:hypothetical protein
VLELVVRARKLEAGVLVPVVLERRDFDGRVCGVGRRVQDPEELLSDLLCSGSV